MGEDGTYTEQVKICRHQAEGDMNAVSTHQQFLILAVYPALASLPKNILPTTGIYSGTVRNRFGPLALVRECFVPSDKCLYQHIPMYIVHGIVRSDIYLLCKFIPQCAVVTCSHTSSKIRRCRANAASAVIVQQKYLRYIY